MITPGDILQFKGTFRNYQQRVIDKFDDYIKDNKFHIVAAPGSGKTTLGIEIIRKLNKKSLVLVPSVAIREQWIKRIAEGFLQDGFNVLDYVSNNLNNLKPITVSTYQAVDSALSKYKGELSEEVDEYNTLAEQVDYSQLDLVKNLTTLKFEAICLDECHHLRSEWWKSLETLKKNVNLTYTISLTATPPYDSDYNEWQRYLDMCGEIDEEISIPELVKAGNLCPHQDYIYFNYPTKKEKKKLDGFRRSLEDTVRFFIHDKEFSDIVLSYPLNLKVYDIDTILENPEYLSAILIFFNLKGVDIPKEIKDIMGYKSLKSMSEKWLEILLQNVLYDDIDSYMITVVQKEKYINKLKLLGFIEKRHVTMAMKGTLKRELVRSIGKCESIKKITFHEYSLLKEELRLLILCDYIKKEYITVIGDNSKSVEALGVVPFFEVLRRHSAEIKTPIKLAGLSGTVAIIPGTAKQRLLEISDFNEKITFKPIGSLNDNSYLEVAVTGDRHILTALITKLFEDGYIQVLIGTKSLLGEGWDSPSVNTLILASFVGSFMLSNQMRGRAIRTKFGNPDKTSHIWHLACIADVSIKNSAENSKENINIDHDDINEDMVTIERRMNSFMGLHYSEPSIENGTFRIDNIKYPLANHRNVIDTNNSMLRLSSERSKLKQRWQEALAVAEKIEVVEEIEKLSEKTFFGIFSVKRIKLIVTVMYVLLVAIYLCGYLVEIIVPTTGTAIAACLLALFYVLFFIFLKYVSYFYYLLNPIKCMKKVGVGVYTALKTSGFLSNDFSKVEHESIGYLDTVYLKGGSGKDKAVFAKTMMEFYGEIDNQRYILYSKKRRKTNRGYFVIPEIFSKNKEQAQCFADIISKCVEPFNAVYTRNESGRRLLLEARKHAFCNQEERAISKKKIKSALE